MNHKIFKQMNCFRSANAVNNTTIIDTFNSDNSNITKTNARLSQLMTTIANKILKFEPTINLSKKANYLFFTVITFSNIIPSLISILW